jgi:hypothetical protein
MSSEYEFGPKMRALTDKQRAFVMVLVEDPLLSRAEAARIAGYSDSSEAAKVSASRLMHDTKIIEALHEQAGKRLWSISLKAAHRVDQMLDSEDEKVVLKAAVSVLDRVGFGAQQNININQTTTDRTGVGMLERIRALAAANGIDYRKKYRQFDVPAAEGILCTGCEPARAAADRGQPERQDACRRL